MRLAILIAVALALFVLPSRGLKVEPTKAVQNDVFAGLPAPVRNFHLAKRPEDCSIGTARFSELLKVSEFDVGHGWTSFFVPCTMGVYQAFYVVYAAPTGTADIQRVLFVGWGDDGPVAIDVIENPAYNQKTQTLSTQSLARAMGDCGTSAKYRLSSWDGGVTVKIVEIRHKAECDGNNKDAFRKVFPPE